MTVYVSNKPVSSRQAYIYTLIYIGDQGIVYLFVGHVNRHWGAFAKRCINNRTIRHDAKGDSANRVLFEKDAPLGKLHAGYSIPLRFYLGWNAFWGRCKKNSCPALLYYMTEGWRLLRWGLGVVPAITYHCNVVPVFTLWICYDMDMKKRLWLSHEVFLWAKITSVSSVLIEFSSSWHY